MIIRESLLRERYVRQVANKAAAGEKYTVDDVVHLFQMTVDSALGDTASAESVPVAWNNLKMGLNDERLVSVARNYTNKLTKLEKDRATVEDWNIDVSSPEYEKVEEKLTDIDSQITDVSSKLERLAQIIGSKHRAPGRSYGTEFTTDSGETSQTARTNPGRKFN